jgi:hypothetical protein
MATTEYLSPTIQVAMTYYTTGWFPSNWSSIVGEEPKVCDNPVGNLEKNLKPLCQPAFHSVTPLWFRAAGLNEKLGVVVNLVD